MPEHLTFRPATDVCWQKLKRDKYLDEGAPPVDLALARARVKAISRPLATQIILKYEWLGTMAPTSFHFGIFWGTFCGGVCCFALGSVTAAVNLHMLFGLQRGEVAVLARGACVHWAPAGANSKLVAHACRLLARTTSAKMVVAYSDVDAGEIGTIYQACNWTYIGRGATSKQWVAPQGRVYDQKLSWDLKRRFGTRTGFSDRLRRAGWAEQPSTPKHRYVAVFDTGNAALVRRIASMRLPYPKRDRSSDSAAPPPSGEGGASPTRSLP